MEACGSGGNVGIGNRPEDLVRLVREAYEKGEEEPLRLHEQSDGREEGWVVWLEL
jgi:hypothetical protein